MGHRLRVGKHIRGHAKDRAGNVVDENKGDHRRERAACPILCPRAADGNRKEQMEVGNDRPTNVLQDRTDGNEQTDIRPQHRDKLSKTDGKSRRGHDGDHHDQHLAKLLQKVKALSSFFLFLSSRRGRNRRLCRRFRRRKRQKLVLSAANEFTAIRFAKNTDRFALRGVTDQYRGQRGQPFFLQQFKIHLCHQLSPLDARTNLGIDVKALAAKRNRLQAHVYQYLDPVRGQKAVGVTRVRHRGHLSVHGAVNSPIAWKNRAAVSQNLIGKHRIGNLLQRNGLSVHGSNDPSFLFVSFGFHNLSPSVFPCFFIVCTKSHRSNPLALLFLKIGLFFRYDICLYD